MNMISKFLFYILLAHTSVQAKECLDFYHTKFAEKIISQNVKLGVHTPEFSDIPEIIEIQNERVAKNNNYISEQGFIAPTDALTAESLRQMIAEKSIVIYRSMDRRDPSKIMINGFGVALPLNKKGTDPLISDFQFLTEEGKQKLNQKILYGREIVVRKGAGVESAKAIFDYFHRRAIEEDYDYGAGMISLKPLNSRSKRFHEAIKYEMVATGVSRLTGQEWGLYLKKVERGKRSIQISPNGVDFDITNKTTAKKMFEEEQQTFLTAKATDSVTVEWINFPNSISGSSAAIRIGIKIYKHTKDGWIIAANGSRAEDSIFDVAKPNSKVDETSMPVGISFEASKGSVEEFLSGLNNRPKGLQPALTLLLNNCRDCLPNGLKPEELLQIPTSEKAFMSVVGNLAGVKINSRHIYAPDDLN